MRKLIQILKIILDHNDAITILFLLLRLLIIKIIFLPRRGNLQHRNNEIQDMRKSTLDELVLGMVEDL